MLFCPTIFALARLPNTVHIPYNFCKLNEPWACCVQYHRDIFLPIYLDTAFEQLNHFCTVLVSIKSMTSPSLNRLIPTPKTYLEIQWLFIRTDFSDHHSFTRSTPFPYLTFFPILCYCLLKIRAISSPSHLLPRDKLENRVIPLKRRVLPP